MSDAFVYDPTREDFSDRAYAVYRELRDRYPLHRNEARGGWAISRYDDVRDACAQPEVFSSEGTSTGKGLFPMLTNLDPPKHDYLRDLLWKAFTPRRIAAMEPRVREIATELIDAFAAEGRCDFLAQFATHLPSRVIGELIGIPPERREAFLGWTESLITADPERDWESNPFDAIYEACVKDQPAREQTCLCQRDSMLDEVSLYRLVTSHSREMERVKQFGSAACVRRNRHD